MQANGQISCNDISWSDLEMKYKTVTYDNEKGHFQIFTSVQIVFRLFKQSKVII